MSNVVFGTIDHLNGNMKSWSAAKAAEFHGPAEKAYPEKAAYIWEEANLPDVEGFIHYGPKMSAYYNANGSEFVLTSVFNTTALDDFSKLWRANRLLYAMSTNQPDFKIVNPIGFRNGFTSGHYQNVTLDDVEYVYYRLQHPNNELGSLMLFSLDNHISTFVSETTKLLKNCRTVLETNPDIPGYPSIKVHSLVVNSGGPYWRFLQRWTISANGCLARLVGELQKDVQGLKQNGISVSDDVVELARIEWQKALNI